MKKWAKTVVLLIFLFGHSLFTGSHLAANPPVHGTGYSLFLQTQGLNPATGAYVTVDAGTYESLETLGESLGSFKGPDGTSLIPRPDQPVDVKVVVPKGAPQRYINAYVAEVRAQLEKVYGDRAVYHIQTSFVDTTVAEVSFDQASKSLEKKMLMAKGEDLVALADTAALIQQERKAIRSWRDRWFNPFKWVNRLSPKGRHSMAKAVMWTKSSLYAVVTISKYGWNLGSGLIALTSAAIFGLFGRYSVEYSQFLLTHRVPGTRRWPVLERFPPIRFYNNHPEFKATTMNLFLITTISYLLALAAYATGQVYIRKNGEPVENPSSSEFFLSGLGLGIAEAVTDSLEASGERRLEQKGYLNYQGRSVIAWTINLIESFMRSFFITGDHALAWLMISISASLKTALYGMGRFLPPVTPKILVISDLIPRQIGTQPNNDFLYLNQNEALGEAWRINPSGAELPTPATASIKKLADLVGFSDLSNAQAEVIRAEYEKTGSLLSACLAGISLLVPPPPAK